MSYIKLGSCLYITMDMCLHLDKQLGWSRAMWWVETSGWTNRRLAGEIWCLNSTMTSWGDGKADQNSQHDITSGISLGMCPTNERHHYIVTMSLIGWANTYWLDWSLSHYLATCMVNFLAQQFSLFSTIVYWTYNCLRFYLISGTWYVKVMNGSFSCPGKQIIPYHANCRKLSNIRHTKPPKLNVSRLDLLLSLRNMLEPSVKWRMKM